MKKILIIEDNQMVASAYGDRFKDEGLLVEVAHDGEDGLEKVGSFGPDAILLDLMLPKMSGIELMKRVRAEPAANKLPIVVFSSAFLTSMVQEAWKAGATQCLSKTNCTPREVVKAIRSALGLNGKEMEKPTRTETPGNPSLTEVRAPTNGEPAAADPDAEFQAGLRTSFVGTLPAARIALRASLQTLFRAENETLRHKHVQDLHHRVHALTCNAGMTGLSRIAHMADALEALLKELHDKPKSINSSTIRTLTSGIDFLIALFDRISEPEVDFSEATVLVVDDEAISRRAITYALDKARLKSVGVEDPLQALALLPQQKYDLIFLDVDLPNMNGFELCGRVRTLPGYQRTPVVFITSLNDFENRANSTVSGGNDFIAKPFLFIELAVKALVYILRAQMTPPQS